MTPRVAFITANFGSYESTCKPFKTQTIPCDFIYFTDSKVIEPNGWIVDNTPWHEKIETPKGYRNSLENNKHTSMIAKFYRQQFQKIPRLQNYDMVIWIDGSMEIISETVAEECIALKSPIIVFKYNHSLLKEVQASHIPKYISTFWNGQEQPYQDIDEQYKDYGEPEYASMFTVCFVAFDNKSPEVSDFLEKWYLETLRYTTNDQIGFTHLAYKTKLILALDCVNPMSETQFYKKYDHDGGSGQINITRIDNPFSMIKYFKQPENSYYVTVGENIDIIMHIKNLIGTSEIYHLRDATKLSLLVQLREPKFISMMIIIGIYDLYNLQTIQMFVDKRTEVIIF